MCQFSETHPRALVLVLSQVPVLVDKKHLLLAGRCSRIQMAAFECWPPASDLLPNEGITSCSCRERDAAEEGDR